MQTAKLVISGMSCDHCVSQIRECLASVSGVRETEVVIGRASIEFDEREHSLADLVAAVHDLGRFQIESLAVRDALA